MMHISLGHIPAQVPNTGITCHFLSFVYFIIFDTLGGLRAFKKPFSIYYVFMQYSDCKSYINRETLRCGARPELIAADTAQ